MNVWWFELFASVLGSFSRSLNLHLVRPVYVLTFQSLAVTVALYTMDSVRHLPPNGQLLIPLWQLHRRSFVFQTCITPVPKTVCFYLNLILYSVSIKITKQCSYIIHMILISRAHFYHFFVFSSTKKFVWLMMVCDISENLSDNIIKIAPTGGVIYNRSMVQKHPVLSNCFCLKREVHLYL